MKLNKLIAISSMIGLLISNVGVAMAAPVTGDNTTVVTTRINGGTLTIQAPADVVLPAVSASTQVEASTVTATDFKVDDARGTKTPAGWTVTATMSKLKSIADSTTSIPFVDVNSSNANDYKLTPQNLQQSNNASLTGVTLGSADELIENDTTGISNPKTIVSSSSTHGNGRYSNDIKIDLKVPANSVAADDYSSTVTFTIV